jgi:hypothetical protein
MSRSAPFATDNIHAQMMILADTQLAAEYEPECHSLKASTSSTDMPRVCGRHFVLDGRSFGWVSIGRHIPGQTRDPFVRMRPLEGQTNVRSGAKSWIKAVLCCLRERGPKEAARARLDL